MMIRYNQIKVQLAGLLMAFALIPVILSAQTTYPKDYFRSPVDFRILLAGTFGELRAGHFHSGIDIKTGGVSGKNVYAVADGYVSRIKVSATGFGKTLYVTHPNGYVSVYAHLSRFNTHMERYVKAKHYQYESFELNVFPEKDELIVKKGEVIALSGNTGGSNGPHIHFEMRLESTQTPVNPLLFGFEVKDYIRPEIQWLKVYPAGPGSSIEGKPEPKVFQVDGWGEQHRVKNNDTIHVAGSFALSINTFDKLNDASNKNGVYRIELYADGELFYCHDLEKFDFVETRYINSLIDYQEYVDKQRRYQRTEVDPNNKLSIYEEVKNDGILHFKTPGIHHLEYVITDCAGNISRLPIMIMSTDEGKASAPARAEGAVFFSYMEKNEFSSENFEMMFPVNALYRDLWFEYGTSGMPEGSFSRVYHIHNERTPVHTYYDVKISPDIIPADPGKLLLARLTEDGNYIAYGGEWDDGVLKASLRAFGDFLVLIDTLPPQIIPVNISSGEISPDRKTVKVKISDERSGIKHFRATLNGEWLLMEYDAKNDLLTYYIDERLRKGPNALVLEVTDKRDNIAVYKKTFVRE